MAEQIRSKQRRPALAAVAASVIVLTTGVQAQASPYDEVIFFGDSLTDSGAMTSRAFTADKILGPDGTPFTESLRSTLPPQIASLIAKKFEETIVAAKAPLAAAISKWIGDWKRIINVPGLLDWAVEKAMPQIRATATSRISSSLAAYDLASPLSRLTSASTVANVILALKGDQIQSAHTTNPDPTWAFHLATKLGGDNINAWRAAGDGGNNQAWGGARATQSVTYDFPSTNFLGLATPPLHFLIPSVKEQISFILQRPSGLRSTGLYTVWAGANDLIETLTTHRDMLISSETQAQAIEQVLGLSSLSGAEVAAQIQRLGSAGAGTVLALNLPDIGRTPRALAFPTDTRNLMSYMTARFNDSLNSQLADYKGNLVMLDARAMLDELIDRPARYGLRNVTEPACGKVSAIWCNTSTLVEPGANRTYLFADDIHPSGIGHEFIADYALSVLQAPARIGLLAEAPLAGTRSGLQVIETRLRNRDDSSAVQTYASYQHVNDRRRDDGIWKPGLGNQMDLLSMGVDGGVGQHWTLGVNAAQIQHNATLGQDAGSFRLGQTQVSAYARYRLGDWSTALIGSAGYLSYRNVSRDFSIGSARLREEGSTTGMASALSMLTQYDWHAGVFTLTPSAGVTLQNVSVRGYNESRDGGRTATSMNYHEQQRRSLASTLGLRLQADLRQGDYLWQPYGGLAWEHEFNHDTREVRAHVRDMAGSFAQTMPQAAADTLLATAGLAFSSGASWSGQIGYYGRYGGATQSQAVQATVAYRF